MWLALSLFALADDPAPDAPAEPVVVADVATAVPTLRLDPDGVVTLVRTAAFTVPAPDDAAVDDEEPVPVRIVVTLTPPEGHAEALSVGLDDASVTTWSLDVQDVAAADLVARVAAIDAECEGYRTAAEATRRAVRRSEVTTRPDLDLLETLAGGGGAEVDAATRGTRAATLLDGRYQSCVRRGSALRETGGEPVSRLIVDVPPPPPGDHVLTVSRPLAGASWVAGYVLDLSRPGDVTTTWVAGVDVPADSGLVEVLVTAPQGDVVAGPVALHDQGGLQPVTLGSLPTTYRHVVTAGGVTRRVRVDNPVDVALPATKASVAPYVVGAGALEPGGHFVLSLGPSTVTVRQRGDVYEARTGLLVPTPIFFPRDPTGCRIAATGEFLGEEEIDGVTGFSARVPDRGTVTLTCR